MQNPIVEQRRLNKLQLYELLRGEGEMPGEKIIALFSLQTGLKRRTVIEYIDELIAAGLIDERQRVHTKDEPAELREARKRAQQQAAVPERKVGVVKTTASKPE